MAPGTFQASARTGPGLSDTKTSSAVSRTVTTAWPSTASRSATPNDPTHHSWGVLSGADDWFDRLDRSLIGRVHRSVPPTRFGQLPLAITGNEPTESADGVVTAPLTPGCSMRHSIPAGSRRLENRAHESTQRDEVGRYQTFNFQRETRSRAKYQYSKAITQSSRSSRRSSTFIAQSRPDQKKDRRARQRPAVGGNFLMTDDSGLAAELPGSTSIMCDPLRVCRGQGPNLVTAGRSTTRRTTMRTHKATSTARRPFLDPRRGSHRQS